MVMQRYSSYRPARVHWLGNIPAHWQEKRGKYFFREVDERSQTGEEELLSVSHTTGVTPRSQKNVTMFKAESYVGHKIAQPDDMVVNTMWAWMSALGVSKDVGIVSPSYGVYRPLNETDFLPAYLDYLLRTPMLRWEYIRRSTGIRSSRLRLYPDQFLDIGFPCPPREEQERMIAFLRAKDVQIRRLIRNKRRLLKLFNEQKQAIVNRAVTRGLNPGAPMKPTGIDWMPEVPAHWDIRRFKNFARYRSGGTPPMSQSEYWLDEVPWVSPKDMKLSRIQTAQMGISAKAIRDGHAPLLQPGNLMMVVRSGILKHSIPIAICDAPVAINQDIKGIVSDEAVVKPNYLRLVVTGLESDLLPAWRKQGATVESLEYQLFANSYLPLPPIEEQKEIELHCTKETAVFDNAIEKARNEIALIIEYRERLIADVVTGKLDVRHIEIAAPLDEPASDDADEMEEEPESDGAELMEGADAGD